MQARRKLNGKKQQQIKGSGVNSIVGRQSRNWISLKQYGMNTSAHVCRPWRALSFVAAARFFALSWAALSWAARTLFAAAVFAALHAQYKSIEQMGLQRFFVVEDKRGYISSCDDQARGRPFAVCTNFVNESLTCTIGKSDAKCKFSRSEENLGANV